MDAVRDQMETKAFDNWEAAKTFLHGLSHRYIYRGEGNLEWDPKPSLERACPGGSPAQAESALISAFRGAAHLYESNLPATDDDLSWLALMQHHGVPTRLLDWTRSPYVAAFFAADHTADIATRAAPGGRLVRAGPSPVPGCPSHQGAGGD